MVAHALGVPARGIKLQKEREMILGNQEVHQALDIALVDPRRRERVLEALEEDKLVLVARALEEYLSYSETFKRPKTISSDRGRLSHFFSSTPVNYVTGGRAADCGPSFRTS